MFLSFKDADFTNEEPDLNQAANQNPPSDNVNKPSRSSRTLCSFRPFLGRDVAPDSNGFDRPRIKLRVGKLTVPQLRCGKCGRRAGRRRSGAPDLGSSPLGRVHEIIRTKAERFTAETRAAFSAAGSPINPAERRRSPGRITRRGGGEPLKTVCFRHDATHRAGQHLQPSAHFR